MTDTLLANRYRLFSVLPFLNLDDKVRRFSHFY
jgi:hypothetical protein